MAARACGASAKRIIGLYLLPNVFPIVTVQITLTVAHAMILEAGLSFLGLGAQPPFPSLGGMLRDARHYMNDAIWYAIFPGLTLTVLLVLITFIADALADAFDPRRQAVAQNR
jgi:peptide/nickel transport system permease protein